MPSRRFRFGDW